MFNQNYKHVNIVENCDSGANTEKSSFIQNYDEVDKVKNISCLDLCDILNKFTSEQVEMLFKEIDNRATNLNNSEYTHFKKISETAKKEENKLEAIVEYIKAGTATASFITALFTLAKSLTG